jgi:hypothetical protein
MDTGDKPIVEHLKDRFSEYLTHVGQVAHGWNSLQESLGMIFMTVLSGTDPQVSVAIWYSQPNDRAQRRLLRAAIDANAMSFIELPAQLPERAKKDVCWLLARADELALRRDHALHLPVDMDFSANKGQIVAAYYQGNPIAWSLRGKNLIEEFDLSIRTSTVLLEYSTAILLALTEQGRPWPDKLPELPRLPRHPQAE